eukprot:7382884-Prymnesium_polylepis.1
MQPACQRLFADAAFLLLCRDLLYFGGAGFTTCASIGTSSVRVRSELDVQRFGGLPGAAVRL